MTNLKWAGSGGVVLALLLATAASGGCDTAPMAPSTSSFSPVQGQLFQTQAANDLALEGAGLYMVGEGDDRAYVRGGRFQIDGRSALVDAHGRALQGQALNAAGGSPTTILLWPWASLPGAQPTTRIDVQGNLDADTVVGGQPFDIDRPGNTSSFSTSGAVFDANGNEHTISVYFQAVGTATWRWYAALSPNRACAPGANNTLGGAGDLVFNEAGTMITPNVTNAEWSFPGALLPQRITLNFAPGLRQVHGPFGITRLSQDGHAAGGRLADLRADGALRIVDGSEELLTVAYVPVVLFENFPGLSMDAPGVFRETAASGPPVPGPAGQRGRGQTMSGFLESPTRR